MAGWLCGWLAAGFYGWLAMRLGGLLYGIGWLGGLWLTNYGADLFIGNMVMLIG